MFIGKTQVIEGTSVSEVNRMVRLGLEGMYMCILTKAGLMCIGPYALEERGPSTGAILLSA